MIHNKKVVVVLPAYNAEKTLEKTYNEIPEDFVDEVILVDDASRDKTVDIAKKLDIKTIVHIKNKGYGANQKTCYTEAVRRNADVIIMLHPDYQYTPKLIVAMASLIAIGQYDVVLGSRILGGCAIKGGMPKYKYYSNRLLTAFQNLFFRVKLSEYHTGYRAFNSKVLEALPFSENSNDFIFDNQILAQIIYFGFSIGEISCPAVYFKEASSISFKRSIKYGFGVLSTTIKYLLQRFRLKNYPIFKSINN